MKCLIVTLCVMAFSLSQSFAKHVSKGSKKTARKIAALEGDDYRGQHMYEIFKSFIRCGNDLPNNQDERYEKCGKEYFDPSVGQSNIRNYLSIFPGNLEMTELFRCPGDKIELIQNFESASTEDYLCFNFRFKNIESMGTIFFKEQGNQKFKILKIKL